MNIPKNSEFDFDIWKEYISNDLKGRKKFIDEKIIPLFNDVIKNKLNYDDKKRIFNKLLLECFDDIFVYCIINKIKK